MLIAAVVRALALLRHGGPSSTPTKPSSASWRVVVEDSRVIDEALAFATVLARRSL